MQYIKSLKVVISSNPDDEPEDAVVCCRDGGYEDKNIHAGTTEKVRHTWLVPEYTEDPEEAAQGFLFINLDLKGFVRDIGDQTDLFAQTEDSGTAYIQPADLSDGKVTEVRLIRQETRFLGSEPSQQDVCNKWGLAGATTDINDNRGGDYLFLGWNTDLAPGP